MKKIIFSTFVWLLMLSSCQNDDIVSNDVIAAGTNASVSKIQVCSALEPTESNGAGRVSMKGKYWMPGQTIRIKFLNGDTFLQNKVKQYASQWLQYALFLKFEWVSSGENADIKIGFKYNNDKGSWSTFGTDSRLIAQNLPSMNFGWFDSFTSDTEFRSVILHEFGHALGLAHEQQNPTFPIQWNTQVVYSYYMGAPNNWTKEQVDFNVLNKLPIELIDYTGFDKNSIMLYFFPASFTLNNYSAPVNTVLSDEDKYSISGLNPKLIGTAYKYVGITGYSYFFSIGNSNNTIVWLSRFFNGVDHFYSENYSDAINRGYKKDGVTLPVYKNYQTGLSALYQFFNGVNHYYTTNFSELNGMRDYRYERIVGYIYKSDPFSSHPLYGGPIYHYTNGKDHIYTRDWSEYGYANR